MSRTSLTPTEAIQEVERSGTSFLFNPNSELRQLKARFLTITADNPLIDLNTISKNDVKRLVKNTKLIDMYWDSPGFLDWFFHRDENRVRIEQLFSLALDSIEQVLLSSDVKTTNAKVNALKVLAELANKFPRESDKKDPLAGMSKEDLQNFLEKSGIVRVEKQIVLETTSNLEKGDK
jgi:hypothetical protein